MRKIERVKAGAISKISRSKQGRERMRVDKFRERVLGKVGG